MNALMKIIAIIYCRVSSERQVTEGHGLAGQELRCKQYAEARGYEVVEVFKDEGVSGGIVDRPGMKKLLDFLESQAISGQTIVVLIDDISRFARDVEAHFQLKTAIESRSGILECVSMVLEKSPMGKLLETIMAGSAEYQRNENRVRVMKNMKSRLEKGYWPFDVPPGYKNHKEPAHGKVMRRDEPKASIIQEALEGFASRRFENDADINKFLVSKSFAHRAVFKGIVHSDQPTRLLNRAALYGGFIQYEPWQVPRRQGFHDAIISIDTLKKIETRLGETKRRIFRKDLNKDFPLRGFLACAHCNKLMTASWSKGRSKQYAFYRCTTRGCTFRHKSVGKEKTENDFEALLARMTPQRGTVKLVEAVLRDLWDKRMDLEVEQDKARQARIEGIDKEINAICDRVTNINSKTLIRKLESKVEQLEVQQKALGASKFNKEDPKYDFGTAVNEACRFIQKPSALWNSDSFEDKRTVLNLAFIGVLPYDKQKGFGTARFALPFELCKVAEHDKKQMVEMPGVEPGSNVCAMRPYGHGPSDSPACREEPRKRQKG
ncbi:MAG: recombinase family protein, partial [Candidatus Babeliales bacterium]